MGNSPKDMVAATITTDTDDSNDNQTTPYIMIEINKLTRRLWEQYGKREEIRKEQLKSVFLISTLHWLESDSHEEGVTSSSIITEINEDEDEDDNDLGDQDEDEEDDDDGDDNEGQRQLW